MKTLNNLLTEAQTLNFEFYNENISYCGLWAGNSYRTKLNVHKILPFNKLCFLHDKGYYLISQNFKTLSFKEVLTLKAFIDDIFYKNMQTQAREEKSTFKMICAGGFYFVIKIFTPLYFLGWKYGKND
jgi:hypothetical protein